MTGEEATDLIADLPENLAGVHTLKDLAEGISLLVKYAPDEPFRCIGDLLYLPFCPEMTAEEVTRLNNLGFILDEDEDYEDDKGCQWNWAVYVG